MSRTQATAPTKAAALIGSGVAALLLNLVACLIRDQTMTGLALLGVVLLIAGVLLLELHATTPTTLDPQE
ncbi:hypothetical protein [Actinomyces radicidentis]|uniref:hypothetical protein n=1 Tax=Actinomyces radicidentis TaxID=111015 RepID=UPI0028E4EBE3|nr:hypothetical protein [Actinomyces radicidentis]